MPLGSSIKTSLVTGTVTIGLLASALPAEARGLRGAFLPGLIGDLAFGAIVASAARAAPATSAYYADVPAQVDQPEYLDEIEQEPRIRRLPREVLPERRLQQGYIDRSARASPQQVENCRNELASTSRPLGAITVTVRGLVPRCADRAVLCPSPSMPGFDMFGTGRGR